MGVLVLGGQEKKTTNLRPERIHGQWRREQGVNRIQGEIIMNVFRVSSLPQGAVLSTLPS